MKRHFLPILGMVVVLALGAAAAAAGFGGRSTAPTSTVKVSEREYRISLSAKTAPAGTVLLVVHNAGHIAHALSVSGPGLRTTSTPAIKPGGTKTLKVKLGGGTFKLWCPVAGHAALGMKASLTVRGAPIAPIGTTTDSTPVGKGGYDYSP